MAVSVTGPRAANQLGGPVIPGNILCGAQMTYVLTLKILWLQHYSDLEPSHEIWAKSVLVRIISKPTTFA